MPEEKDEGRSKILSAISTPIQLAALIVLVVEGLLAYLLSRAEAGDISLYVSMMVGVLALTIAAVFIIEYKRIKLKESVAIPATGEMESAKKTYKWDVFLAAPMAALSTDSFENSIEKVREIKRVLEEECGFNPIFFAGINMANKMDFDTADVSIETDVNALKESKNFIMIYPEKIVSSVLFEAGMALALGKPSFYFGDTDNFPFLMQQANQKFSHVKIHDCDTLDKIIAVIKKNKNSLFKV
jgi:nucleoside 2-deoxyribosyltransferase